MRRSLPIVALAVLFGTSASAAEAPAELRGTSVVLRWKENRIQRDVGEPNFYPVGASHDLSIYIAADGLVFTRLTNTTGAGSGRTEQVAGLGAPDVTKRVPDFGDHSMVVFLPFRQGGMRRATIEFDRDYKTCKARVAFAREEGATQMLAYSPITRKMVEFKSATTSGETCTLRPGNIFGN